MKYLKHPMYIIFYFFTTTTFAQSTLSNGLIAYYKFDGNFSDSSGNNFHATQMGGTTFGPDYNNNQASAALFDGINDYLFIDSSVALTPDTALAIAFRFNATKQSGVLFSKSDWTGGPTLDNVQYQVAYNYPSYAGGNGLFIATEHDSTCRQTPPHYLPSGAAIQTGQWNCAVVSFSKGEKRIYLNGNLVAIDTLSGYANNTSIDSCTSGSIRIGAWWVYDPHFFKGLIDDVRIYNRSLTDEEVNEYCNNIVSVYETTKKQMTHVYPNPAHDVLYVTAAINTTVIIYNITGQQLLNTVITNAVQKVDISGLTVGCYYIKFISENNPQIQRFVKR